MGVWGCGGNPELSGKGLCVGGIQSCVSDKGKTEDLHVNKRRAGPNKGSCRWF